MTALQIAALVEGGHGLVGASRLYLHEVGAIVAALFARHGRRVDVLPGRGAAEHVVDLLELAVLAVGHLALDVEDERTRVAREAIGCLALLDDQYVAAVGTKVEHDFLLNLLFFSIRTTSNKCLANGTKENCVDAR